MRVGTWRNARVARPFSVWGSAAHPRAYGIYLRRRSRRLWRSLHLSAPLWRRWSGEGIRAVVYGSDEPWRTHAVLLLVLLLCSLVGSSSAVASRVGAAAPRPLAPQLVPVFPASMDAAIDTEIAHMSLDEELGQLFIAELRGTTLTSEDAAMVGQLHAGGIILYNFNLQNAAQAQALITSAQNGAALPLLVTVDEEGGFVDRLAPIYGRRPSAAQIGATGSTDYAFAQGKQAGEDMAALGFNLDLAPDVDVELVAGPDQVTRTFGSTPAKVTSLAGAYLAGLHAAGVGGTLKHFPGLGAATSDAHKDLPEIDQSRTQIEAVELAPYRALVASGQVDAIMATDLLMPALDPSMPAELSPTIMTGVLRGDLGYNGVIITDALYMAGIADRYSMPQAGVLAIEAGDDLLEGPWTAEQMAPMIAALRTAVQTGQISKARIDASVHRILALKERLGILHLVWARPNTVALDGPTPVHIEALARP